jgi:4'-phosphopantetheinyl transferase
VIDHPAPAGAVGVVSRARLSLWWAPLDIGASALRGLAVHLSPEEWRRREGYHRPLDRDRFVAARGWLRHLLARQLGCDPGEVGIVTDDHGKPRISSSALNFSVDIESIRPTAAVDGIAARFFTGAEQRALASLPAGERLDASFRCWTRKEAYGKGIGTGLDFPLHTVDVGLDDGRSVEGSDWSVHQVAVGRGLAAAVAGADVGRWIPGIPHRVGGPGR